MIILLGRDSLWTRFNHGNNKAKNHSPRSTHDFSLRAAASFLLFLEILTTNAATATALTKNGRRRMATIPIVEAMVN